jgi:hypothetical protein
MTNPVSYVGFVWGTRDLFNQLDVYNGSTLLGSFIGVTDVGPYYFNIFAGSGEAITTLVLNSNSSFETDNYSAIPSVPGPSLVLAFPA